MHIGRWIIGFAAGLLLFALLALFALAYLVDANRFRGPIENAMAEATGRPFRLEGDIEVAWFPWLALRTGPAHLGNPPEFAGPPLLEWQAARVGVRLLPLIRGELVVDRVRFEGLRAHLRRTADGRANWEGLLEGREQAPQPEGGRWTEPRVGGVEIRDGALEYIDEQSGTRLSVSDWQLDVGAVEPGRPVSLETRLTLTMPRDAQPQADERAPADRQPDSAAPVQAADQPLDGYVMAISLQSEVHAGSYTSESRTAETGSTPMTVRDLHLRVSLRGGSLPESGVPLALDVPRLAATLSPLQVQAPEWSMEVAQAKVAGTLQLARARAESDGAANEAGDVGDLRAEGRLEVSVPSLKRLIADLGMDPPQPKDPQALEALGLRATWSYTDDMLALKPLEVRLDETNLAGELTRTGGDATAWRFQLRGDRINFDRYTSAKEEEDEDQEPFELPVEMLRELDAEGELVFAEAQLANAKMKNVRLRVLPNDGNAPPALNSAMGARASAGLRAAP